MAEHKPRKIEVIDYELERIARNLVYTADTEVRSSYWKIIKGAAKEIDINPVPIVLAARKYKLNEDTKRQNEGKNKARRPSSLMRQAKQYAELHDGKYVMKRYFESRDYRDRLIKGGF